MMITNMRKEEIPFTEKSKEKESEEISRYELDPEKGIDVVVKTIPGTKMGKLELAQVILEQNNENILDFKNFLPENYKFVVFEQEKDKKTISSRDTDLLWFCNPSLEVVAMPRKWNMKSKDILSILHETSHSFDKDFPKKYDQLQRLRHEIGIIETDEKRLNIKSIREKLNKLKKEYLSLRSRSERCTWARALNIIKK